MRVSRRGAHRAWPVCCALALVCCTREAYLGAIVLDAGGPTLGTSGSRGEPPPSAAGAAGGELDNPRGPDAQAPAGNPDAVEPGGSNDAQTPEQPSAAGADSGVRSSADQPVCLAEPSFEIATPAGVLAGIAYVQPPWTTCFTLQDLTYSAPLFLNETTLVDTTGTGTNMPNVLSPASEGSTYLYLDMSFGGNGQTMGQPVCDTLHAGQTYAFAIDLMARTEDKGMPLLPGTLEVYASPDSCSLNAGPLWSSQPVSPSWTRQCVRFTPAQDSKYLMFRLPKNMAGRTTVSVDNIRFEPGCGLPPT